MFLCLRHSNRRESEGMGHVCMPVKFPVRDLCKALQEKPKIHSLCCDLCERWLHFNCIDMCLPTFNLLASSPEPYLLSPLYKNQILFSNLANEEIQWLFNHVCNEKQNTLT